MIDESALWSSLPVPAILLDPDDMIDDANPAAELFLNASLKSVRGQPVWDRVMVDAPMQEAFDRARETSTPLFVNDVDVGTGERVPLHCNLQIAPLQGRPGFMILLISPRELAGRVSVVRPLWPVQSGRIVLPAGSWCQFLFPSWSAFEAPTSGRDSAYWREAILISDICLR